MATVVPFASCYARNSISYQPLFGKGRDGYLSNYKGPRSAPRGTPRPRLIYGPKMTIRQICYMLRIMRRETAMANARKVPPLPAPTSPNTKAERRCLSCFRRRRSKRVG